MGHVCGGWGSEGAVHGRGHRGAGGSGDAQRPAGQDQVRVLQPGPAGLGQRGAGRVFYSISYPTIDPLMGVLIGLKAFAAAVLGGIGSVTGAVLGGFILGFTEVVAVASTVAV